METLRDAGGSLTVEGLSLALGVSLQHTGHQVKVLGNRGLLAVEGGIVRIRPVA